MSDLRLVGAVGIKVRPDTSKFREDTQKGINEQLGPQGDRVNAKAKVKVDADTKQAEVKISKFEKEVDGKEVTLNVGLDHDSVQRAREQIDRALKSLDNHVFKFGMDRPSLERVKAELDKLAKNAKVEFEFIQDEAGYQSVLNKIKKIRNERDLKTMWKFGTDDKSLREAEAKANAALDRIQADKTIDIRYSDNYDGMKQAIAELDSQLENIRKLRITTKLDENSLEEARADLVEMMQFADVTVRFNEDKQGYETVLSRIRKIQREKLEKEITFKTDDESLRQEAAKYEQLIEDHNQRADLAARFAPVTIEYNEDLKGYQDALAHIKRIQREKLVKKLELITDEAHIAAEIAKFEALVKEHTPKATVTLEYNQNRSSLEQAIKQIDNELTKLNAVKLPVDLDAASLLAEKRKLQLLLSTAPLQMKFLPDEAGYQSVLKKIKDLRQQRIEQSISFTVDEDGPNGLAATEKEIKEKLQAHIQEVAVKFRTAMDEKDLEEAKHQAEQLKDHIDHMKASMQMELAGSELTSARLAFLGRDRVVNYIAKVNERSVAVAEGLLKSVGGLNTFSSLGSTLEGIFTKFDTYSLKATALATALGSIANVGVYAGTAAFKIGEGVVQSLGLLAAAPAILGAATAGYTIFTAAFNNFFDAFNKDPKIAASSLAALPPLARKTVDSITGLYKGLANPIQERFWEHVGTTLSDAIEKLYPNLKAKLLESTEAVGDFVAGFGRAMTKLSVSGDLDKMFDGFKGFFQNLSKSSEPFFDAWNRFGVQGSTLLPRFGDWISRMAVRFDDWSKSLGASGITDMIEQGVHSLQNMWGVGGDVVDMFKAITRAAGAAGTGGLAQFHINMRKAADAMLSEPWQSKAATIFEGARKGASELNGGFRDLTGTFGNASVWLGTVLTQLGHIGGATLTGLSDLFGSQKYQDGISAELKGVSTLVDSLRPSFLHVGDAIGDMGKVAGSVFGAMGPVINQLTALLAKTAATISDNLAAVAPKLLGTVSGVLRVIDPMVSGLIGLFDGFLGVLKGVPNSFVAMGVAATAFFAMRGLASKFFDSFRQTGVFKNLESNWLSQQVAAGNTVKSYKLVDGQLQKITVPTEKFNTTRALFDQTRANAGLLRGEIGSLGGALVNAGGSSDNLKTRLQGLGGQLPILGKGMQGLWSMVGGGWGLAFMGAAAILGGFAQAQQDANQHVETLTASINKQTGAMNQSGLQEMAKRWTDLGKAGDWMSNLNRGSTLAANETFERLNLSIPETTVLLSQGGQAAKDYANKWQTLGKAMNGLKLGEVGGQSYGELRQKAEEAAGALGLSVDKLDSAGVSGQSVMHVFSNLNDEIGKVDTSRFVFDGLAKSTDAGSIGAQQLSAAMVTIGDSSLTAAQKIGAINKALDLLKGGKMSAREAEANAASAQQQAVQQAEAIRGEIAATGHMFNDTTKLLDLTAPAGLKLYQAMETSANGIKIAAQAAYEEAKNAGKPPEVAMAAATAVVDAGKDKLQQIADASGVSVDKLKTDWEGFFGKKWELNAVFSASADKFLEAKKVVEGAGLEWNDKAFKAILDANKDPATMSTEKAKADAANYANTEYKAQLDAMNQDALKVILDATGQADAYKRGDYTGVMKALNSTGPEATAARNALLGATTHDGAGWLALIKAYVDAMQAERDLAALTKTRAMNVAVTYVGTNSPRPAQIDQADGAFYKNVRNWSDLLSSPLRGQVKMFANGGIENHVAQIAYKSPQVPFRVWAEAEGGEAYIPLAASKRTRSVQILEQVAKQFGYSLSKGQAFADGGIIQGGNSKATSGLNVHIGTYNQNANDTIEDVGRGIMRQARIAGVTGIMDGI